MRLERTAEMWPVGNYLEFFLAAAFTQLLFWILMAYRYLSDFGEVVDYTTWQWSTFAVILNCTMGWMILVGMGIASNLWPIVYQNTPFNPSIIRAGISMNIAGQVVVFIAHLLLQRQVSVADQVLTIGVSLLCLSAFIGASPAWSYWRSGDHRRITWGWLPLVPAGFTMLLSLAVVGIWLEFLVGREFSFFSQGMFVLLNVDLLWMTIGFACVVGHLQRRCEWPLLTGWRGRSGIILLVMAFAIHTGAMLLDHTIWNEKWWIELPFILPILWMAFLLLPPILQRIAAPGHQVYNRAVVAAVLWLPIIGVLAAWEALYTNTGLINARYLMLFGFGMQAAFGFSIWMHQDHKHLPEVRRRQPWVFIICLNLSLLVHLLHAFAENPGTSFKLGIDSIYLTYLELVTLLFAMITWLGWWIHEIVLGLHDWHKMPMFYSTIYQTDDPYILGEE